MKFPVAIQVYSVRDAAQANLFGTLKQLKEMGYDGVEFAGLYNHTPEEIRDMCAELGLVPLSAHVPLSDLVKSPTKTVATYKTLGCRYVAIPYLSQEFRPGTDGFDFVIEAAKMIGKECKKNGMTLLYHNHDFEFVRLDGKYALDVLYDKVPADCLQTELDTCWVNVGGENPAEYLLKYAGRSPVLHLKDFIGSKTENMYDLIGMEKNAKAADARKFEFRPVGHGKQDFPAILAAAEKAKVEWIVVEQDEPSEGNTPMECAKISRDYLKSIGN